MEPAGPIVKSIRWLPDSAERKCANLKVHGLTIAAYPPVDAPEGEEAKKSTQQTNEWVLYLPTSDSTAIRIEPVPYGEERKKTIVLLQEEFELVDPITIKTAHMSIRDSYAVCEVVQLIQDHGYDKYEFLSDGSGGRWWVYSLITLLRHHGFFESEDEFDVAVQALKTVWYSQDIPVRSWLQTSLESNAGRFLDVPKKLSDGSARSQPLQSRASHSG